MLCRLYASLTLWHLGYPDQALQRVNEAVTLAQELSHPIKLSVCSVPGGLGASISERGGRRQRTSKRSTHGLCHEHGFPFWLAEALILRGWGLVEQGKHEEGVGQIRQGVAAHRDTGVGLVDCSVSF